MLGHLVLEHLLQDGFYALADSGFDIQLHVVLELMFRGQVSPSSLNPQLTRCYPEPRSSPHATRFPFYVVGRIRLGSQYVALCDLVKRGAPNRANRAAYPTLLQLSGCGAAVGAALFLVSGYVDRPDQPDYLTIVVALLSFLVPTLFFIGLIGLYMWCKGRVGRLGEAGLLVGLIGSSLGILHGLSSLMHLDYVIQDRSPSSFHTILHDVWLPVLFTGLTLVGIANIRHRSLRGVSALALAMGVSGWIYDFTDSSAIFEVRVVHVGFGVLFSLGWVALGLAFWARATRQVREPRP